jgi:LacI family transcriptional regulator
MVDSTTEEKGRRSTIKDVAAEADVSISTVSLVINDRDGVSPDTRERVLRAARLLGYIPSPAARRLAQKKTGNVGFILRDDHFTRSEPFYTRIFLGTEFEARGRSLYVLLTTVPGEYIPGEHTPRFLRELNVDGVLVAGKVDPILLEEIQALEVPVVLIDFEVGNLPAVVIDNQQGARAAVEHLIARGHERIAFLGADVEHPSLKARLEGYRLALAAAGLPVDSAATVIAGSREPDRATGAVLAPRLMDPENRPTAVFCANDALALGVLDYAHKNGISVPEDLAVAGFDDVYGSAEAVPALTTVRVFKEHLGELALRYLAELTDGTGGVRGYARSSHTIKVATELVVRAST